MPREVLVDRGRDALPMELYFRGEQRNADVLDDILEQYAFDGAEDFEAPTDITNAELLARAEEMLVATIAHGNALREKLRKDGSTAGQQDILDVVSRIDRDDTEALSKWEAAFESIGIVDLNHAWMTETVAHMLKGLPMTISPAMPDGTYEEQYTKWDRRFVVDASTNAQGAGWRVANFLRTVCPSARIVAAVHDQMDHTRDARLMGKEAQATRLHAINYALDQLSGKEYTPGRDVAFLTDRDIDPVSRGLLARICDRYDRGIEYNERSGGFVLHTGSASVRKPLRGNFPPGWDDYYSRDVWLSTDGRPTLPVQEAATSLMQISDEHALHLRIFDKRWEEHLLDSDALLRMVGEAHRDRLQTVMFDGEKYPEDLQEFAFIRAFEYTLVQYMSKLLAYDTFQMMDPIRYLEACYGEKVEKKEFGILPEDLIVIQKLCEILPRHLDGLWGGADRKIRSLSIGNGPFSFLNLAVAPWTDVQEWADVSGPNMAFLMQYKNQMEQPQHNVGPKFEGVFTHFGGEKYEGSDQKSRKTAVVSSRSFSELTPGSYEVILDNFTGCSYDFLKDSLIKSIYAKKAALTEDGVMISVHMVESDGWDYAGGKFPASKLSAIEIIQAYEEAGMEILEALPATPDGQWREGQKGTVLVVARQRPA